jgi:hypothetical protein
MNRRIRAALILVLWLAVGGVLFAVFVALMDDAEPYHHLHIGGLP